MNNSPGPPVPPKPPRPPEPANQRGSCLSIFLAIVLLTFAGGLLFFLPLLPGLGVAVIVFGGGFAVVLAFHYYVWGRWLTRILQEEQEPPNDD